MNTYAIGDIQGCYDGLRKLLDQIGFRPEADCLWCVGDLVNRGTHSLEVLRFLKNLPNKQIVLGNHDFHLIALAGGNWPRTSKHTLDAVLSAPDCDELVAWLCEQPIIHHDPTRNLAMVHAGLAPSWSIEQALPLNLEIQAWLKQPNAPERLHQLYGNTPDQWDDALEGDARLRCVLNYCTRMRFLEADGRLNLSACGPIADAPEHLHPWFMDSNRNNLDTHILFGHWSALGAAELDSKFNVTALDGGYIWGGTFVAMNVDTHERFILEGNR